MRSCEYNAMEMHQKALKLSESAVLLGYLVTDGFIYSLYSYNNYYIEACVDSDTNYLLDITAIDSPNQDERMDKYFSHISLADLL